jgi:hypothetical protein
VGLEPTAFGPGDPSSASDHIKEVAKKQGNFTLINYNLLKNIFGWE